MAERFPAVHAAAREFAASMKEHTAALSAEALGEQDDSYGFAQLDGPLLAAAADAQVGWVALNATASRLAPTNGPSPIAPGSESISPNIESHSARIEAGARAARELLQSAGLGSPAALLTESLRPLRAAIARATPEADAEAWAAYHVVLGSALRLRSHRMIANRRAEALVEATRALDSAYYSYLSRRSPGAAAAHSSANAPAAGAHTVRPMSAAGCKRHRPADECASQCDGSYLVTRIITAPAGMHVHLLERAILWLRVARAAADCRSWDWVSSSNNLACALTLLGNRTPTLEGLAMLREAAHVLGEVLETHAAGHQHAERPSTLINLAEVLLSMGERATPAVRLQSVERAVAASSIALLSAVPPEYAWLVRLRYCDLGRQ